MDLFRVQPSPSDLDMAPQWAKLMYQKDVDVSKVIDAYTSYYKSNSFEKTIHTQNYKHWIRQVEGLLNEEARIEIPSKLEEERYFSRLKKRKSGTQKSMDVWSSIGPFETYKNGTTTPYSNHANVYSIDQSENNSDLLICGTESGGVFKTLDKGLTWSLISKSEVFCNGITSVAIDPTNDDIFYIGGNNRIYKSTDGGVSWTENFFVGSSTYEIKFDPGNNDHMFLASGNGLYESTDGAMSWTQLMSESCWDIDFHPTNDDIIYSLISNPGLKKTEFYKSIDDGISWTLITSGWYEPEVPADAAENGGKIAVSINDPDRVYACLVGTSKSGDNGWIGLYRSNDSGSNWYLPSGQIGGPYSSVNVMPWNAAAYTSGYHQGFYNFDCEASPSDADLVWFGTIRLNESSDGGVSYQSIGAANSQRLSDIHADIQSIHLSGSDIWVASDGGINYSNDDLQSHSSRKYGIIASNFWGFGTGWNEDVLVGGKYHNGNTVYHENYGLGNSHNVGGVEEATGYVNPLVNKNAYFNQYWSGYTVSKLMSDTLGGSAANLSPINLIPNESYNTSYSSGFYHHPVYAHEMVAGKDSIIWKSHNGGTSWEVLHDFGQGRVLEIEYARSNPDVIYCVFQPVGGYWDWCTIYRTTDAGETWTELTTVPSNNRWRLEITVNPENPDEIWAASVNGANGQKVYKSTDGGTSWTNMSSSILDDNNVRDIAYHAGSDQLVYLLTAQSFFYYNASNAEWVQYDSGLPTVQNAKYVRLFYRDSKLRICTSGRGFWEADMPMTFDPIALPMTLNDTLFCQNDTVQLESHSVIDHNNALWNWSITPAPSYIESTSMRNPKVVFGMGGYYDIALTVTDENNTSSSSTINNMIYVENYCDADTIPGKSLLTENSGDYIQLPDFNVTTDAFSIMAWIKPSVLQDDYASILMNDGVAAGLNFREGNNTLAYHWSNGGQWWWDSNMIAPVGEWSHVAMVVDPTGISLYLNGVEARHNIAISPIEMTTMKIASYKGWASRNYKGEIDELSVWNRSLTMDEIRLFRHLTLEDQLNDPDLLAYYQFNSDIVQELDKANAFHGVLNANASRLASGAALGGGTSAILNVNSAGNYIFGNTGIELNFPGSGTLPNGPIVATRINLLPFPDLYNSENLGSYFILNNYGSTSFTDVYDLKYDDPYSSPSPEAISFPDRVRLLRRPSNSFTEDWNNLCSMDSVDGEYYSFAGNASCMNADLGQHFLNICLDSSIETIDYLNGETIEVKVSQFIEAYNTIFSGADVLYSSEGSVDLKSDFEVKLGAIFEANNTGCQN